MKDIFTEGLDPEQREAVSSTAEHLLVAAPPGSGKTRVLASRFARLVEEHGPAPVLAVTFTNRAAREMAERVEMLTGLSTGLRTGGLRIGTFHAVCLSILKERLGAFDLWGREETVEALKDLGVKAPARAAERISLAKNTGTVPEGEDKHTFDAYSRRLADSGALDIDDLVPETIELLEGGDGDGLFTHVLVDEYQDINPVQARLVKALAGAAGSVAAIGDPDQSIYGFRGSTPECFLRFTADRPGSSSVRLVNNYRSARAIVEAASAVIANNPGRAGGGMTPVRPGGAVTVVEAPDERAEAGFVVREIERLYRGKQRWEGLALDAGKALVLEEEGELFDIRLLFEPGDRSALVLQIRGIDLRYDAAERKVDFLGRSAPLEPVDGQVDLRLLVDRTSLELFGDRGALSMSFCFLPEAADYPLLLRAEGGSMGITSLIVRELCSVW